MSTVNINIPPKEDKNKPKPDTDQPASFEPTLVMHNSKPSSHPRDGNRWSGTLFRRKKASPPASRSQAAASPVVQPTIDTGESLNPDLRLRDLLNAGKKAPPLKPHNKSRLLPNGERTRRAYWDVAAGSSLIINAILVALLIIMAIQINNLKTTLNGFLSGLYGNFVEMDKASITTTITVDTQVPINFMLPIQQNTEVSLTQSVAIPKAYVVINSGGFTINSQASVTLPAGTNLPIALDLEVPVQATVPVTLQVPVNIPLAQTELNQPFIGLQDTVRAYYCTFDKNAQYPQGIYICKDHDLPTSTPGVP